jgi:aminoglycoside phosphotransferase family enzyme
MSIGPREDSSELGNGNPILDLQASTSGIQISAPKFFPREIFSLSKRLQALAFQLPRILLKFRQFFTLFVNFYYEVFRVAQDIGRVIIYSFLTYSIDERFISPVTIIFFTHSRYTGEKKCLKMWQRGDDELYNSKDPRDLEWLWDGFAFNRKFAPGVYLGIAPVNTIPSQGNGRTVKHGLLIREPKQIDLKRGVRYWLVMRQLDENWRLDRQLAPSKLGTKEGMEFLAREVIKMHKELEDVKDELGKPIYLSKKLQLNIDLFNDTLKFLEEKMKCDIERYKNISSDMERACQRLTDYFNERYKDGHVKRCHGDLKTINLWVRPLGKKCSKELLALDCIDFNPLLYCIDTLSDVAMLAVDMEVRLRDSGVEERAKHLMWCFLKAYLDGAENDQDYTTVWLLLEYYMAEKAMACAHLFIMYNNLADLGKKYLDVALRHVGILKAEEIPLLGDKAIALEVETSESCSYVAVPATDYYSS